MPSPVTTEVARGCYVALRLALDHPEAVDGLVAVDGVPMCEALARCEAHFARTWWHWFFYAQEAKPERAIPADPTVGATFEDYRAGLGIDREHELKNRQRGRKVTCRTLLLWSSRDDMEELYGDPRAVWAAWADDMQDYRIESGHHMAEENPHAVADAIQGFLSV